MYMGRRRLITGLNDRGVGAVELVLALPYVIILIFTVVGIAFLCARGEIAQLGAIRAARVAKVFKYEQTDNELLAMLTPQLFRGGSTQLSLIDLNGRLTATTRQRGLHALEYSGDIVRGSAFVPALNSGLSDRTLRGGDSPSPYCRDVGGYRVCGFR